MIRTNVHLTEPSRAQLGTLSKLTGLPIAELIRRAIDAYLVELARRNLDPLGKEAGTPL
jgi:predicted DNA-binding protein